MTKNIVTTCLIIFIIIVVAILGSAVFSNQNNTKTSTIIGSTTFITALDVAKHSTSSDCWTIVSNKVYNVTALIPIHSGGPDQIIAYCGKDATTAFDTKNGRGPHSQRAQKALNAYYIGDLSR
ncbi:MAG: hypothetical protein NTY04_01190 [Candidatus Staskawiczbacteria bacterium]|nr:hypothetical protein [Candidatus Staskawiczbacteria bacterium]